MSKTLDYREAMQAYLDGKQLQKQEDKYHSFTEVEKVWEDLYTEDYKHFIFPKAGVYRIKPQRMTLWISGWAGMPSVTTIYSVANPWGEDITGRQLWVENLPHRFIED